MKLVFCAIASLAMATSCPSLASAQSPPTGPAYQAILLGASQKSADDLVKIEVATGTTWIHCCTNNNVSFSLIKDASPPPPGDYRVMGWSHIESDGTRSWEVYRFDRKTGHTWVLTGGGSAPYGWADLNQVD